MEFSFLPYSIVNDSNDPKDYDSPYSFLAFIQYQNFSNIDANEQLKSYQQYVNTWASKKNLKKSEENAIVRDAYVNLMREITLNFATEEEKRFILNADFEDDSDLDIIIPFFIQKIKQISLYYSDKRKEVKNSLIKYNLKGSNFGVETIVKKLVYDYIDNNLRTNRKDLSSFHTNFDVSIVETYSDSDPFYDKSENTDFTYTNKIDPNVFINIKQSIIDAISAYPFYLKNSEQSYISNFAYNPILSGTELSYLKERDFIEYVKNGENSLKINLFKDLYRKFIGTDFYYLSTNANNQTISGVLFDANLFNGQYLNKHFPTTILTESLKDIYSIYEIGGFFVPQNQGILIYNTPKKTYQIDTSKIDSDKIYIFPDPNKIGNTIYTSEQENENIPLIYLIDVQWNRTKISNGYRFNDVLSNNYNQLFYGYQSRQQNTKVSTEGIAKVTDNVTFWKGEKNIIWDGSFDENINPIDKDKSELLLDEGVAVDWYCDESSNEFALYKKVGSYAKDDFAPSRTPEPSQTPTPTPTQTPTITPTVTLTPTSTPTETPTPTPNPTVTQTSTPTPTPTITPSISPTPTLTPTPSLTPDASPTPTPTVTPSISPSPTLTPTPTPTLTPTPSLTPASSPTPTPTLTPTQTPIPLGPSSDSLILLINTN